MYTYFRMGFFSSPADKYSQVQHEITELDIKKMISHERIRSLDHTQVALIEETLLAARGGDGKLSMRQAYEALHQLFNQQKISKLDQKSVIAALDEYFEKKGVSV